MLQSSILTRQREINVKRFSVWVSAIALLITPVHLALAHGTAPHPRPEPGHQGPRHVKAKIKVTAKGFEPSTVRLHEGDRLTLLVTRKTDETCVKEIVMLGTKHELPVGKTVRIYLGPRDAERITFACAMDMYKGEIVVEK